MPDPVPPTDWSRGYPVAETYPVAWHGGQAPMRLRLACDLVGVAWEPPADLSYADLGCGTGYSANVLAAANPEWQVFGLDYMPEHIAAARALSEAADLRNTRFLQADLVTMTDAELDALPEFDVVALTGFWSWVGDPVREGALRLIRRRLKPGGLVVASYNSLPGAAGAIGLQRIAREFFARSPSSAAATAQLTAFLKALQAAEPRHLTPNHWLDGLLGDPAAMPSNYVLHELATEHWRPTFFADFNAAMGTAGLEFVGSAALDENLPYLTLSPAAQRLHAAMPDRVGQEIVTDFCVPRFLRQDIFVRGLRRVAAEPVLDATILTRAGIGRREPMVRTQTGTSTLPAAAVQPMIAALDRGPCSVAQLRDTVGRDRISAADTLTMMICSGSAVPRVAAPAGAEPVARRFNRASATLAAPGGPLGNPALAVPALGNGLAASREELTLIPHLLDLPPGAPADPAALARALLPPDAAPEAVAAMEDKVVSLLARRVPVLRELGVL